LENLSRHPAGVDEKMMKRRLTAIGGDGAVIKGGASARHGSTNAGSCFRKVARGEDEECIEWDPFHREDVARKRAFRASPLTTELFDVSACMSQLFGTGAGRIILRSAAEYTKGIRGTCSLGHAPDCVLGRLELVRSDVAFEPPGLNGIDALEIGP